MCILYLYIVYYVVHIYNFNILGSISQTIVRLPFIEFPEIRITLTFCQWSAI